jgi:hypothetical protein
MTRAVVDVCMVALVRENFEPDWRRQMALEKIQNRFRGTQGRVLDRSCSKNFLGRPWLG